MSRKIQINGGDFEPQIAEYDLVGLYQKPAIVFYVFETYKFLGYFNRRRKIRQTWLIADCVTRVERINDADTTHIANKQWNLPQNNKIKGRFYNPFRLSEPQIGLGRTKAISFRVEFTNGQIMLARADARIFQNFLAVTGG